MNRKSLTSLIVIAMAVAAIGGGTLAWFTAETDPIENVFVAGTVEIEANETLRTPGFYKDNWNPGDCAEKEFTITNKGSKAIALRAKITTQWYERDGDEWTEWTPEGEDAVTVVLKEMDPPQAWIKGEDGNWYYNGTIAGTYGGAEETSVKFILTVCLDGPQAGNQYQGKRFVLAVTFQAIQASHADQWNWEDFDSYN